MQKTIKLAKHNGGKIIHVDDALNGLACNCICLVCGERLQAIHPRFKQTHFRHNQNLECTGGPETALHLFAKQIILEHNEIILPGRILNYTNPQAEVSLGPITPDVTVEMDGVPVYFEITVTHKMVLEKQTYYCSKELKSVEIDLAGISYDFKKPEIEKMILEKTSNKSIIFWEKFIFIKQVKTKEHQWILWLIGIVSIFYIVPKSYVYIRKKLRF